jgi:hypothetical protein
MHFIQRSHIDIYFCSFFVGLIWDVVNVVEGTNTSGMQAKAMVPGVETPTWQALKWHCTSVAVVQTFQVSLVTFCYIVGPLGFMISS